MASSTTDLSVGTCPNVRKEIEADFQNWTPERIARTQKKLEEDLVATLEAVSQERSPSDRTFANTLQPLIDLDIRNSPESIFYLITNFFPDEELRTKATEASEALSKFNLQQFYRPELYQAVEDYYAHGADRDSLTSEQRRYLEHTRRDFRRHGLHLPAERQTEVIEKQKELTEVCSQFHFHLNQENTTFQMTQEELSGMPKSWFQDESKFNAESQTWTVTLKYPDYLPLMEHCTVEKTRHTIWKAFNNRARDTNEDFVNRALKLRSEIAYLLGYETYADYETQIKIVKDADTALQFVKEMDEAFTPAYQEEQKLLLAFAQEDSEQIREKGKLDPWDLSFFSRKYKEAQHEIDTLEVKKYFPLEVVRRGLFQIYQEIFRLKFARVETENRWHEEVELYSTHDSLTGQLLGYFYLDLHPRPGKYGHAAVFTIYPGCDISHLSDTEQRRPAVAAMACNFPKGDTLPFKQVVTFFHEFGHLMHHLCSQSQLPDFSGLSVERDFVETPSQMLEFWCYEAEPLALMSEHVETKKPIPQELITKLRAYENTLQGYFNKRQLSFGIFDLRIHTTDYRDQEPDANQEWIQVCREVLDREETTETSFVSSFSHLLGGYQAGYYGYLLALNFASNLWLQVFKKRGMMDPKVGLEYRKKILEPGSSRDGMDLLSDFLPDKVDTKYLLMSKGLIPEE